MEHTLVTGGWRVPSGKRALVFVQPDGQFAADGQVLLRTRIGELPDETLARLGLADMAAAERQSSSHKTFSHEEVAGLLTTLESTTGVDLLSAPAAGQPYETGPLIDVTPQIAPDGSSVQLNVLAQLRFRANP